MNRSPQHEIVDYNQVIHSWLLLLEFSNKYCHTRTSTLLNTTHTHAAKKTNVIKSLDLILFKCFYFILVHISLAFSALSLNWCFHFCYCCWCWHSCSRCRRRNSSKIFARFICWVVRKQCVSLNGEYVPNTHARMHAHTHRHMRAHVQCIYIFVFYWLLTLTTIQIRRCDTCYENFVHFVLFILEMCSSSSSSSYTMLCMCVPCTYFKI